MICAALSLLFWFLSIFLCLFWYFVFCFSGCWGFCLVSVLWVVEPTVNFVLSCLKTKNCSQFNCGQFLAGISLGRPPSPLRFPLHFTYILSQLCSGLFCSNRFSSVLLPCLILFSKFRLCCVFTRAASWTSLPSHYSAAERGHPLLAQQAEK